MRLRRATTFTTVRTEGALLPADLLSRIASSDPSLDGLTSPDYGLAAGEKLGEAITRSWTRLRGAWSEFRRALEALAPDDPATRLTRERWTLALFRELGYGRLAARAASQLDGKAYPVSHLWGAVPIHLVGYRVELDRRTRGVAGAARTSPHGMVQELLNRSDAHLWALVSNGQTLRVLRDSLSLTRQAFVEFDLEGMMEGEVYSDFALLWLLCHRSRHEGDGPDTWIERWSRAAQDEGTRALDRLRSGVAEAIEALGQGFIEHPANVGLREALRSGALDTRSLYRQLLRLVYRLIFLFVAEDRDLLLAPHAPASARRVYGEFYSTARLRRLARTHAGTRHGDLWHALRLVMEKLDRDGCQELGLPPLGSFLWSLEAVRNVVGAELANARLLAAIRALTLAEDRGTLRAVDYRNLGSEEFGSIYESLLELHPEVDAAAGSFVLVTAAGHSRKTTGSYYTSPALISRVLDAALDPAIRDAAGATDPEAALLSLRICDPACGSGHFLLAAAHRIAKRLAAIRAGEEEPPPAERRRAVRDVIRHCIHGVDLNEMAVELCKVTLWLETLEPGKPLSFLDHRILCGDSLLGATPAAVADGVPDEAFVPIEGDERKAVSALRKRNRAARKSGQLDWVEQLTATGRATTHLSDDAAGLDRLPDDTIGDVEAKSRRHAELLESTAFRGERLVADAWCAAFVWPKTARSSSAITEGVFRNIVAEPLTITDELTAEIERLRSRFRFLHWHLTFPEVFRVPADGEAPANETTGWSGGFDVILGNPPWEKVQLNAQEFFSARAPEISRASSRAARSAAIEELRSTQPELHAEYLEARRHADGVQHIVHHSGLYPLSSHGQTNTAPIFLELALRLVASGGHVGLVVPTAIATDNSTRHLFQHVVANRQLRSLHDFENRKGLFPGVHRSFKFSLLHVAGPDLPGAEPDFAFFLRDLDELDDEDRRFTLSPEDFRQLSRNTGTCPVFRSRRDADLVKSIYRRVPILHADDAADENRWAVRFLPGYDISATDDDSRPRARDDLETEGWELRGNRFERESRILVPVYEAKMARMWDHRAADVTVSKTAVVRQAQPVELSDSDHEDPGRLAIPRFWAPREHVDASYADSWSYEWFFSWRDITSPTNERTVIGMFLPRVAVSSTLRLLASDRATPRQMLLLMANLNSFILDYCARQVIGGIHVTNTILKQLPVLPPSAYVEPYGEDWVVPRILELVYTARDMEPLARDCGYEGEPFRWDPERRFRILCELDAAFFHLHGLDRDEVEFVMDGFPIVRRRDDKAHGTYRTKDAILAEFAG